MTLRLQFRNSVSLNKAFLLYGAGSYAKLLMGLFPDKLGDQQEIVFIDSTRNDRYFSLDRNYFESIDLALHAISVPSPASIFFQIAIGNHFGFERFAIYSSLIKLGCKVSRLQHSQSLILSPDIHESAVIMPRAIIMPDASVGACSIVNTAACIDHESVIKEGCHIMGNAYVAGRVSIGRYSTIGSNSTVFPDVEIGENCFIGSGSVVNKHVPDNQVVVGNPARFIKFNRTLPENLII